MNLPKSRRKNETKATTGTDWPHKCQRLWQMKFARRDFPSKLAPNAKLFHKHLKSVREGSRAKPEKDKKLPRQPHKPRHRSVTNTILALILKSETTFGGSGAEFSERAQRHGSERASLRRSKIYTASGKPYGIQRTGILAESSFHGARSPKNFPISRQKFAHRPDGPSRKITSRP